MYRSPESYINSVRRVLVRFAVCGIAAACAALAAIPASADTRSNEALYQNLRHAVLVRQAFTQDPELGPLNLGVHVTDRVAYLWGSVPSETVAKKAQRIALRISEIRFVQSLLLIEGSGDATEFFPRARVPSLPPVPTTPWLPQVRLPGQTGDDWEQPNVPKVGAPRVTKSKPKPVAHWQASESVVAARLSGEARPPITDVRFKPAVNMDRSSLEDRYVLPSITVPSPKVLKARGAWEALSLADEVESLRATDPRYRLIRVRVDAGHVHLTGSVDDRSDVYALARDLSRLPRVERVVIGQVELAGTWR